MAGVFECGICANTYDETGRKPLMLPCGHTYCQRCLHNVVSGSSPACPSCRKEIVTPVNELSVNFIAIPSSSGATTSKSGVSRESSCSVHQNELDYWCTQCQISICKRCLVEAHADHKFILIEAMTSDKKLLSVKKYQITAELQQTKAFIENLQLLESLGSEINERKYDILAKKNSLQMKKSVLTGWVDVLEKNSSEPSQNQNNALLKILKYQTQARTDFGIQGALQAINNWVPQLKVNSKPDEPFGKLFETYMPDGQQWDIISTELAEKALRTMKETHHKTPKAFVKSTDANPILCLPELLLYLAASSASIELQLMDGAERKYPDETNWIPLMAGGVKSTNYNHCYRIKALMNALTHFQAMTAATKIFGQVCNYSNQKMVVALLYPATHTYDVCVLTHGKVVNSAASSWPLPLEIHVMGLSDEHWQWVKWFLPSLYKMAQRQTGECRVYLPGYNSPYLSYATKLLPLLANYGKQISTQHRVYLPIRFNDNLYTPAANVLNIALEFRNF